MPQIERPKVQLESPFGALTREGIITNVAYALIAMRDSLKNHGEAPFASHLLYTQMLDDTDPLERDMGIEAGLVIGANADYTVVYQDLGISRGMHYGIDRAEREGRAVIYRQLYEQTVTSQQLEASIREGSPLPLELIGTLYARTHQA